VSYPTPWTWMCWDEETNHSFTSFSGLASISLRSTLIAAECLETRHEQEEAYSMLWDFKRKTGWQIDPLMTALKNKWGRGDERFSDESYGQPQVETHHVLPEPASRVPRVQSSSSLSRPRAHGRTTTNMTTGHGSVLPQAQEPLQYPAVTNYYHDEFETALTQATAVGMQSQLLHQQSQYIPPTQPHQHMMAPGPAPARPQLNGYQDLSQYQNAAMYATPQVSAYQSFSGTVQTHATADRYMTNNPTSGPSSHSAQYSNY
jgi:hypothetical protein